MTSNQFDALKREHFMEPAPPPSYEPDALSILGPVIIALIVGFISAVIYVLHAHTGPSGGAVHETAAQVVAFGALLGSPRLTEILIRRVGGIAALKKMPKFFSPRQDDIVKLVLSEHDNPTIGAILNITKQTVKNHISDSNGINRRLEKYLDKLAPQANIIPVVTPMKADGHELDADAFNRHLKYLKSNGATAVMVTGTTGEIFEMDSSQQSAIIASMVSIAKDQGFLVYAHITGETLADTYRNARVAASHGADVLVVAPLHFEHRTDRNVTALVDYLQDIGKPIALYSNRGIHAQDANNIDIDPKEADVLYKAGKIVAIKVTSNDKEVFKKYVASGIPVYMGDETLLAWGLENGARGVISAIGNVRVGAIKIALPETSPAQREELQNELLPYINVFSAGSNFFTKLKFALSTILANDDIPLMNATSVRKRHELSEDEISIMESFIAQSTSWVGNFIIAVRHGHFYG